MKEFFEKYYIAVFAFILWVTVFVVYLQTLAPTIGFIDSGELATVASTLGIAHPTGYPLFTLLGKVFSLVPFSSEEIVRLNVMSALFTSSAAVVFFFLMLELLKRDNKKPSAQEIAASIFASFTLAFSQTFWSQGVSVEVYSLHVLLILLTTLFFVQAINSDQSSRWFLFAYTFGLSFTNHLTSILLAPSFLFLFFAEHRFTRTAFRQINKLMLPFILGLSVYLYLPIRAASQPLLNWGNPQSFEKFWWHITGKQFRGWMFASSDAAQKQLNYFIERVPAEFFYIPVFFAVIGFFILLFSNKKKFVFVLLLLVACVTYSINYDIHDIDSYFLLAFISMAILAGFGILKVFEVAKVFQNKYVFIGSILAFASIQVLQNWEDVDQSSNYLVEDYTKNILSNLPPHSIILSYQWDYFISASYYFQHVKNFRSDVIVLDKELLRRSWYFAQLGKMHRPIMQKSKQESEFFLSELNKFEHGIPYDYTTIEGRYVTLIKSFIEYNIDSIDVYLTREIEPNYTSGYNRIPEGFAYKLTKGSLDMYRPAKFPSVVFRKFEGKTDYSVPIEKFSASILYQRGLYEREFGKDTLAELYFSKVREMYAK